MDRTVGTEFRICTGSGERLLESNTRRDQNKAACETVSVEAFTAATGFRGRFSPGGPPVRNSGASFSITHTHVAEKRVHEIA